MKLLEEIAIRYLIGVFIAALIAFLFWWFVIHNETDRIVEREFPVFYNALDEACFKKATKDNPVTVYIKIPQKRYSNPFEAGINWIKEKLGMQVPFTAFQDPYYRIYWEKFPPEAPYTIGDVLRGSPLGTLAAFYFPWSEDLPWSTNLMSTMMFMTFAIGMDVIGTEEFAKFSSQTSAFFKKKGAEILEKMSDKFPKIDRAIREIEEFVDKVKNFEIKLRGKILKIAEVTKETIHEIKFISRTGILYTMICLTAFDKTVGECVVEGVAVGIVGDGLKLFTQHYVVPKIQDKLKVYFSILRGKINEGLSDFADYVRKKVESISFALGGGEKRFFENADEFNKILDECKEYLDKAKSLLAEGKQVESLDFLKKAREKISEASELLKRTPINEEFASFFYFSRLDLDVLASEIDEILEELNRGFPKINPYIDLDNVLKALDKVGDDSTEKPIREILKENGFRYDEKGRLVLTENDNEELFKSFRDATKTAETFDGKKVREFQGFKFEYDKEGNLIKVIYDFSDEDSLTSKMKKYIFGYPKKYLALLESSGFIHNKVLSGDVVSKLLEEMKEDFVRNEKLKNRLLEGFKKIGREMSEQELFNYLDETIKKWKSGENMLLVVEKKSKLAELLDEIAKTGEVDPKEISRYIREALYKAVDEGDKTELLNIQNLIKGKSLKLKEDLEIFFRRGVIGYAALRAIDLYTPLGASWWDKYISYYGYEGQRIPEGCQPNCEEGKICLQLGACIRNFDLPESCRKIGIVNVKLERNSIVAPNPRFYLVSPCYSTLKIYVDQNDATLFIKPEIDEKMLEKTPNYCYATESFVNYYIGSISAQYALRCAGAVACSIIIAGSTAGLATPLAIAQIVAACLLGAGSGWCGFIVDIIDLAFSFYRESTLVWPTVYNTHPWLISYKELNLDELTQYDEYYLWYG